MTGKTLNSTRSRTVRALLTASLLPWLLVACASGPKQEIAVTMTDSGMTVEPTSVGDAAGFEFRFVNNGSDSRHPVVVVTTMTPDDLEGYIEQHGIEEVINALLEEGRHLGVGVPRRGERPIRPLSPGRGPAGSPPISPNPHERWR